MILRATGEYRYIDLETDPKELVGIVEEPTGEAGEALRRRLVEMLEGFGAPRAAGEVRSEWIEELRALGYVE